ncbi:MAG: TrmH family RNA methyltransferase [Tenacibaculum sp.]
MGLSKNSAKFIIALQQKKYRQKYKLFVAEGVKVVKELLASDFEPYQLFGTDNSLVFKTSTVFNLISEQNLKKISTLKTPNKVLALFKIPRAEMPVVDDLILALDGVSDPGNLGTIIRLCHWFGLSQLICSSSTVDCYNQKVIQASMGSIAKVNIYYTDLSEYLTLNKLPVFSTDTEGDSVYQADLPQKAVLVMGSETQGVSNAVKLTAKAKLCIPSFGNGQKAESLNVATATAVLLSEFRRRQIVL